MVKRIEGESTEIELTHPQAIEMAFENVSWQADDTYFDASLEVHINGKLFFENGTTDAYGTWRDLVDAIHKPSKQKVTFLDSPVDLNIHHDEQYTFHYNQTNFLWNDHGYLISSSKNTITSEPLPKQDVESAIRDGFKQFAEFILTNDIPIAKAYKQGLQQQLDEWQMEE